MRADEIFAPVVAKRDGFLQRMQGEAPRWLDISRSAQRELPPTFAVGVIRHAQRQRPKNANIQFLLAETLARLGDVAAAQAVAAQIPSDEAQTFRASRLRAQIAQRLDRWADAKGIWQEILREDPDSSVAARGLARCCEALGDCRSAIAAYQEALRLNGERPPDHLAIASLQAREEGRWLGLEEIRALHERFPEDLEIAIRYVNHLRSLGDERTADRLIAARSEAAGGANRQLAQVRARKHLNAQRYEEAAELLLETFAVDHGDLRTIITAASWLALAKAYDAADLLLAKAANDEASDEVLRAQARLRLTAGDRRAAFAHQVRALRLCGNLANHTALCEIFLESGRAKPAADVMRHIAGTFGETKSGWSELGVLHLKAKNFTSALPWLERAGDALLENQPLLQHYANALWQAGDTGRAWYVLLALATGRRPFLAPDAARCEKELQALRADLASCKESLSATQGNGEFIDASLAVRRLFSKPHLIKWNGARNQEVATFMRTFTRLEGDGDLEAAAALVAEGLDSVVAQTSLSVRLGDVLYRAARVHEALGRHQDALDYLAQALWMNKHDPVLHHAYRAMLRSHAPPLRLPSDSRVLVLIPTWEKSAPRARFLAEQLRKHCGLSVMTVQGEPTQQTITCTPASHGFDLRLPCEEGYLALPAKLMLAYRYLGCCSNCLGVFKMDDDAAVADFGKFSAMLRHFVDADLDYAGRVLNYHNGTYHHGRNSNSHQSPIIAEYRPVHFCRGEGYYLSRRALRSLLEVGLTYYATSNPRKVFEDVLVAEILETAGIAPVNFDPVDRGGMLSEILEPLTLLAD